MGERRGKRKAKRKGRKETKKGKQGGGGDGKKVPTPGIDPCPSGSEANVLTTGQR